MTTRDPEGSDRGTPDKIIRRDDSRWTKWGRPTLTHGIAILLALAAGFGIAVYQLGSSNSSAIQHGLVGSSTYIVYTNGSTFFVQNGTTGALAYSSSDAAASIQWAIDAIPEIQGGSILVRTGVYPIHSTLQVFRDVWLQGDSVAGTILKQALRGDLIRFAKRPGTTNTIGFARVSDLTLAGNHAFYPGGSGINDTDFSDTMIDHNFIVGFAYAGVRLGTRYYNHIVSNWIEANGYGIVIDGAAGDNFISDNTISISANSDILVANGTAERITDNTIKTAMQYGIFFNGSGLWSIVSDNHFTDNGLGGLDEFCHIYERGGGGDLLIEGNEFLSDSNLSYVISLVDPYSTVITGNYFESSGSAGWVRATGLGLVQLQVKGNTGYVTENSGVATILAGHSNVTVLHGLSVPPKVIILSGSNPYLANIYWSSVTNTSFLISANATVPVDSTVSWEAEA